MKVKTSHSLAYAKITETKALKNGIKDGAY